MSRAVARSRAHPDAAWSVVVPAVAALMSVVITIFLWRWAVRAERTLSELDFHFEARAHEQALQANFEPMLDSLYALHAFVTMADEVRLDEFEHLAAVLIARQPALRALEWIPYVPGEERARHEGLVRAAGFPNYRITERQSGAMVPAGQRAGYMPVMWVVPMAGNEMALGYDLLSEPMRKRALQRAIAEQTLTLTEPIELVQDESRTPGFLVALPLFRAAKDSGERVRGVVLGVFQAREFVTEALGASMRDKLVVHIVDPAAESGSGLVFVSDAAERPETDQLVFRGSLPLGGRAWALTITPPPDRIDRYSTPLPLVILVAGFLFTGLMGALCYTSLRSLRYQRLIGKEKYAAEAAGRDKARFLANMSHEIRTPLHGILGASAVLEDTTLDEESRRYVGVINRSAKSLSSLLSDILDFSNIESGKLYTELAPFDLRQTVRDVYHLLLADAAEKQLSFTVHTDGIEINHLVGDFGRIRQILINLVGNAIKFTTRGSIELICRSWPIDPPSGSADSLADNRADKLDVKAKKQAGQPAEPDVAIVIEVRDTGIGIADEQMSKVFDYFAQLDSSTTRAFGGAGLGLAISRRLAQLMGGDLSFESVKGKGSTFIVNLKLVEYRDEDTLELARPGSTERTYDKTALLVEDNRVNMLIASKLLSQLGLTIDTALNGREAVSKVQDNDYDLVIMDLQMPVMDGIEATRRIRQLRSSDELPIVALTANAMQGTAELCFAVGMNGYLTKPIARKALIAELDRWLKP